MSYLIDNRSTAPQIADMLGVSVRTVRRRMTEFSLSIGDQYSDLSDHDLNGVVEIQRDYPMCGNRQMQGHLLSRGLRLQQSRIDNHRGVWTLREV